MAGSKLETPGHICNGFTRNLLSGSTFLMKGGYGGPKGRSLLAGGLIQNDLALVDCALVVTRAVEKIDEGTLNVGT